MSKQQEPRETPAEYVISAARAGLRISAQHAAGIAKRIESRRQAEDDVRAIDTSQHEPAVAFRPRRLSG